MLKRKHEPRNRFYCPNCQSYRKFKKIPHPKYQQVECTKCHQTFLR